MLDIWKVIISGGVGILGTLATLATVNSIRRKNDSDASESIAEATKNVVDTLLLEQKRQTASIVLLEESNRSLTESVERLERKLHSIGELILTHEGESIPKAVIAAILKD